MIECELGFTIRINDIIMNHTSSILCNTRFNFHFKKYNCTLGYSSELSECNRFVFEYCNLNKKIQDIAYKPITKL